MEKGFRWRLADRECGPAQDFPGAQQDLEGHEDLVKEEAGMDWSLAGRASEVFC